MPKWSSLVECCAYIGFFFLKCHVLQYEKATLYVLSITLPSILKTQILGVELDYFHLESRSILLMLGSPEWVRSMNKPSCYSHTIVSIYCHPLPILPSASAGYHSLIFLWKTNPSCIVGSMLWWQLNSALFPGKDGDSSVATHSGSPPWPKTLIHEWVCDPVRLSQWDSSRRWLGLSDECQAGLQPEILGNGSSWETLWIVKVKRKGQ